jgi:alkaline phosphatase
VLDRHAAKEPSLAEMTTQAIGVLSKNEKGFFLMMEGSKVDWAAYANDPTGINSDVLSFDDAVKGCYGRG